MTDFEQDHNHVVLNFGPAATEIAGFSRKIRPKILDFDQLRSIVSDMTNQLEATRARIATLAKVERGTVSRDELIAGTDLSRSSVADFETGLRWPRSSTLRRLEGALGWPEGIIDEALASEMGESLTLDHLRGKVRMGHEADSGLSTYTDADLLKELERRTKERQAIQDSNRELFAKIESGELDVTTLLDLAASKDLGKGVKKGQLPND